MVLSCCFSASSCRTKAVDDSASAAPMTKLAARPCDKAKKTTMARIMPVIPTCKLPIKKMDLRISQSRCGRSSSPIMNINRITPNSANSWMASGSLAILNTLGPSKMPVNKYPSTVAIPKRLANGTKSKDAPRKIVICNSSDISLS